MKTRMSQTKENNKKRSPVNSGGATEKWTDMIKTQGETIMTNRTKLTEKELAIGMWLYIKTCLICCDDPIVAQLKYVYMKYHDVPTTLFENKCILCDKYNQECSKCPLHSCSLEYKTLWSVVVNRVRIDGTGIYHRPFTLEERLEACDIIIEAIQNDIPDDYVSPPHYL